jgi:hypothetical protein
VYRWIVFLHIAGALGLVLSHGTSMMVAFRLRTERDPAKIRAMLDLSRASLGAVYGSLTLLLVAGIIAGFVGHWWRQLWIWTALALLIAIIMLMYIRGNNFYHQVRRAVGLQYQRRWYASSPSPAETPVDEQEIAKLLRSGRPFELATIGVGGILVILWLMIFKPF